MATQSYSQEPNEVNTGSDELLRVDATADEGLDDETGLVEGKVAEVAKDKASENQSGAQAKAAQGQSTKSDDDDSDTARLSLRERLLKSAPKEHQMRQEVVKVLKEKKSELEADVRTYKSNKEYHLLAAAVAQLRAVIRELELVARAGYEALREIWLKVVHQFA